MTQDLPLLERQSAGRILPPLPAVLVSLSERHVSKQRVGASEEVKWPHGLVAEFLWPVYPADVDIQNVTVFAQIVLPVPPRIESARMQNPKEVASTEWAEQECTLEDRYSQIPKTRWTDKLLTLFCNHLSTMIFR